MKVYSAEIQIFINANLHSDLHSLLLKKSPFPEVPMQEIVRQIKGRKVAEKKFPFLLKEGVIFPPNLNLEQSSSEATALYKAALVSGKKMADLTLGFGIDAWFFADRFEEVFLVEQNPDLLRIVEHNWKILGKKANFLNQKLEDFLENNSDKFDLIFLDPARRDENKNKVFLLEDLSPNLLEIQHKLFVISDRILIKLSPLIDLKYLISVIKNIVEIHIVALKNEVKEVLVLINSIEKPKKRLVKCVNLETGEEDFEYTFGEEESAESEFSPPLNYLYIPNNSLLKAGCFNLISQNFGLRKLHQNSHFYTSDQLLEGFPGRILEVEIISAAGIMKNEKYNIISKNHPLKPEEIKKKYKLRDGGEKYLIFTQDISGKIILKSK